jgi:hypothetical protein
MLEEKIKEIARKGFDAREPDNSMKFDMWSLALQADIYAAVEACLAAQPVSVTLEEAALEVFENVFAEPCIHTHDGDLKRMAAALAAVTPAIEARARNKEQSK